MQHLLHPFTRPRTCLANVEKCLAGIYLKDDLTVLTGIQLAPFHLTRSFIPKQPKGHKIVKATKSTNLSSTKLVPSDGDNPGQHKPAGSKNISALLHFQNQNLTDP
ncbi:hypothetical protein E2320_010726 [Naja naja]|nr:hypothetical protein E2320_010726 [Naja naja]